MRLSRYAAVGLSIAGRTAAGAHRPRADGKSAGVDSRRTLRRARSGRARAFPPVPRSSWPKGKRAHPGARDASRRGNHAGFQSRAFVESGPCPRRREKETGPAFGIAFRRVRFLFEFAVNEWAVRADGGAVRQGGDLVLV